MSAEDATPSVGLLSASASTKLNHDRLAHSSDPNKKQKLLSPGLVPRLWRGCGRLFRLRRELYIKTHVINNNRA